MPSGDLPLPRISVVMPVRDMPLGYVMRAVSSAQEQDYAGDIEVVIWNDGSVDERYRHGLEHVARTCRDVERRTVTVRHSSYHRGISAARNAACAIATGEWFFWLDGDDTMPPGTLTHLVGLATRRSELRLVVGQCELVLPHTTVPRSNEVFIDDWRTRRGQLGDPLLRAVFAVHGTLVHRRTFGATLFDESMTHGELTDWFLRTMAHLHRDAVAVTDRTTYRYHKRAHSHSADRDVLDEQRRLAMRRYARLTGLRPRMLRFVRRCAETGARHYELLTTRGTVIPLTGAGRAVEPAALLVREPVASGAGRDPADRRVAEGNSRATLVAHPQVFEPIAP